MHSSSHSSSPPAATSTEPTDSVLVAWDFNGVIDTYGSDLPNILQTIIDRNGQNIIVSNGTTAQIHDYLFQREMSHFFNHIYGMDLHHGLVARHKVAAIAGHIQDQGPFQFVLIVGDNLSDIEDGRDAGVKTCLFDQHHRYHHTEHAADYVIYNLTEVVDLLPV